jgi:hypothetical protein
MIRGPRHENILAEREQIVNADFHAGPNGWGLVKSLTIPLAMPCRLVHGFVSGQRDILDNKLPAGPVWVA